MRIRATREDLTLRRSNDNGSDDHVRSWRMVLPFGPPTQRHNLILRASDVALLLRGAAMVEGPVNRMIGTDPQFVLARLQDDCGGVLETALAAYADKRKNTEAGPDRAWICAFFQGVIAAGRRPPDAVQMIEGGARGGARTPEVMTWVRQTLVRSGGIKSMLAENEIDVAIDISGAKGTVCYLREANLRIGAPPTPGEHHVAAAFRLSADIIQAQEIFDDQADKAKGGIQALPPKVQIGLKELTADIRSAAREAAIQLWPQEPDFFSAAFDEEAIAAELSASQDAGAGRTVEQKHEELRPAPIEDVLPDDFSDTEAIQPQPARPSPTAEHGPSEVEPEREPTPPPPPQSEAKPESAAPRRKAPPLPDTGDPPAEDLLDVSLIIKRLLEKVTDGLAISDIRSELHKLFTRISGMLNPVNPVDRIDDQVRSVAAQLKTLGDRIDRDPDVMELRDRLQDMLDRVSALVTQKRARPPVALSAREHKDVEEIADAVAELAEKVGDDLDSGAVQRELGNLFDRVNTLATYHTML